MPQPSVCAFALDAALHPKTKARLCVGVSVAHGSCGVDIWGQSLAGCVTPCKLFNFSVPQRHHLENECDDPYLIGLLYVLKKIVCAYTFYLVMCLVLIVSQQRAFPLLVLRPSAAPQT